MTELAEGDAGDGGAPTKPAHPKVRSRQEGQSHFADLPPAQQNGPERLLLQQLLLQQQAQQQQQRRRPLMQVSPRHRSHSRIAAFLQLEESIREEPSSSNLGLLGLLGLPAPAQYCVYRAMAAAL